TSISAKRLKRTPFPSITGLPASAPILPRPSTADPLVTTPTRFPLAVYLYARAGSRSISRHGTATPGVYARLRSLWVRQGLVGVTEIFPAGDEEWYSRASSGRIFMD